MKPAKKLVELVDDDYININVNPAASENPILGNPSNDNATNNDNDDDNNYDEAITTTYNIEKSRELPTSTTTLERCQDISLRGVPSDGRLLDRGWRVSTSLGEDDGGCSGGVYQARDAYRRGDGSRHVHREYGNPVTGTSTVRYFER
ncbi:hypothetical protein BDW59DRAFT_167054 [Aspergillus cavernicola]|uniref:Uncharacterized protein n=1 Tax=Aspergillus cavernicola TaxID=176166 RepID=A0ABR4HGU6_9EURO